MPGIKFIATITLCLGIELSYFTKKRLQLFYNFFNIVINAIKDVIIYSNSRLKVVPEKEFENDMIVSRERVGAFKRWFGMS